MSLYSVPNFNINLTLNHLLASAYRVHKEHLIPLPLVAFVLLKTLLKRNKALTEKHCISVIWCSISLKIKLKRHCIGLSVFAFTKQRQNRDFLIDSSSVRIVSVANLH